jgi:hypothetical protein
MNKSGPVILLKTSNEFEIHEAPRPNELVTLKKKPQYTFFPL